MTWSSADQEGRVPGARRFFGEGGWIALQSVAKEKNVEIVASERFSRTDTNFTPQALKLRQANPEAIYIHAIPPSSALVHQALKRVGYTGPIYHSGGSANNAFISIGKNDVEGALLGTTPVLVYTDLADNNPLKPVITKFAALYEKRFNVPKVDIFPGQAWDAVNIALRLPPISSRRAPSSMISRPRALGFVTRSSAIKDFVAVGGIFNYNPDDHLGLDQRSTFIAVVKDGEFRLYTLSSGMFDTAVFLLVDGLTNGPRLRALALSLVLVFTVTRVVNIAQGEYVMLGALTLADLLDGRMPGTLYLLIGGLALWVLLDAGALAPRLARRASARTAIIVAFGIAAVALTRIAIALHLPVIGMMLIGLLLVAPLGVLIYRFTVHPIPNANTIVFVIISVGVVDERAGAWVS